MTDKRYSYDNKSISLLRNGEFWLDGSIDTACNHSEICDELNALFDENQELKQNCKNYSWYRQYKIILNENEELQTNLEELQGICKEYENKLYELKKEKKG